MEFAVDAKKEGAIETVSINLLFHCYSLIKFFGNSAQLIRQLVQGIFWHDLAEIQLIKLQQKTLEQKKYNLPSRSDLYKLCSCLILLMYNFLLRDCGQNI